MKLFNQQEAEAFENKQYIALHRSTARKVDIFANIIQRIDNNILKTNTSYWEQHGGKWLGIFKFFNSNPVVGGIIALFTLIGIITTVVNFFSNI